MFITEHELLSYHTVHFVLLFTVLRTRSFVLTSCIYFTLFHIFSWSTSQFGSAPALSEWFAGLLSTKNTNCPLLIVSARSSSLGGP